MEDNEKQAASIYLTSDGRVILQGRAVSQTERATLSLPPEGDMISVDRNLIQAIKDMLLVAQTRTRDPRHGPVGRTASCS